MGKYAGMVLVILFVIMSNIDGDESPKGDERSIVEKYLCVCWLLP